MFIIWGTKEKRKDFGHCASLCKVCHDITSFKVTEIHQVSHLYYIPMGRYKFVSTELVCSSCKNTLFSSNYSNSFHCDKSQDINVLKRKVPESEIALWEESVETHKKIQQDPSSLSKEERIENILESFLVHEDKLSLAIEKGPNIDGSALLGCLPLISIILFMIFLGEQFMDSSLGKYITRESGVDGFGIGMLFILIAGGGQVLWLVATNRSRFLKKEIYPLLAANLAPLRPNIQELSQVKAILKEQKFNMRSFSIPKLQMAISEQLLNKPK